MKYDSDENPFDPENDKDLRELNNWTLSPYVDKTHFVLKKVVGAGSHSVVWLVERRPGKRTMQKFEDYYFNRLTQGRLEFIEALKYKERPADKVKEETATYKNTQGKIIKKEYAMKIMDKRKLYQMRSIETVKAEMNILATLISPFIVYL